MRKIEIIKILNKMMLEEMPQYCEQVKQFPPDEVSQRRLLRSLMNVRAPLPLQEDFIVLQDQLLTWECAEKGVVDVMSLATTSDQRIALWQGDITRLSVYAIVNAANSALLGCFAPCHGCIDNAIHSAAGLQLRQECYDMMRLQGHAEPTGSAKITKGYNLPCKYILHTVGPIINDSLTQNDCNDLANCYRSCLALAAENGVESIAFCCISTGEFHFPNQEAAIIAVETVSNFLHSNKQIKKVIFNVFKQSDLLIYEKILT